MGKLLPVVLVRDLSIYVHIWKCSAEKLKLHELSPHLLLREDLIHIKTYL